MSRLFISYCREDGNFAKRLADDLKLAGANVWIDVNDITPGIKWSTAVQRGLLESDIMVVILSPEAVSSTNVEDEWQAYLDEQKPVIPILLRPINQQMPFQLRRLQYIDFHQQDYRQAFEQLKNALQRYEIQLTGSLAEAAPPAEDTPSAKVSDVTSAPQGQIFETMVKFFEADDWNFTPLPDQPVLSTGVSGKNGKWRCYAKAREEQSQFLFYSVCDTNVPEHKRPDIAEFLTRANYGLLIGNFEMDYNDGEVRYKTSIDVEDDDLSMELIRNMVYANVTMMDRYLPGMMAVIWGNVAPLEAIKMVED
jgi:hypothetical protein